MARNNMTINKMLIGAHSIIYSRKPEADRAFLRDVFGLSHVDVGEGWLIFGLPPAELAVHPSSKNNKHELYFMCKDIHAFVKAMKEMKVPCSKVQSMSWGERTQITLPGGGKLGIYEPRHASPKGTKKQTSKTKVR
jgi:hypothetical protein